MTRELSFEGGADHGLCVMAMFQQLPGACRSLLKCCHQAFRSISSDSEGHYRAHCKCSSRLLHYGRHLMERVLCWKVVVERHALPLTILPTAISRKYPTGC